jgi:D-inositol-3-phosphate glycosyltransferase
MPMLAADKCSDRDSPPSRSDRRYLRSEENSNAQVALLTAGRDKPYALGLAAALIDRGIAFDFIGSDDLDARELRGSPLIAVRNLRGDQTVEASLLSRVLRILAYYWRLVRYAASTRARILHILWNNKFELIDRTGLMLYYRLLGKKIVLTAHNVNIGQRDGIDNWWNRTSLHTQYRLADHIFVHTGKMKAELQREFGVAPDKVTLIPFGINDTLPKTNLRSPDAKRRIGVSMKDRTILFFGNIAPYKGLHWLVSALAELAADQTHSYRLIIAGKPKGSEGYWKNLRAEITRQGLRDIVIERITYIPDGEVELLFKAADVLALPYSNIYQSGVLFLSYSFGLPVVATDVGSFAEDVVEGQTGLICRPGDPGDLARALRDYFESPLCQELEGRRKAIQTFANERYSWTKVGELTECVYRRLLGETNRPNRPCLDAGRNGGPDPLIRKPGGKLD